MQGFDGSVGDERHEPRCVLHLFRRVYHEVWRSKLEPESNGFFELRRKSGLVSSLSELGQIEGTMIRKVPKARKTVSLAGGVQAKSHVDGDKSGSRERDQQSQEGERRRDEKDCDAKWKARQLKDWL